MMRAACFSLNRLLPAGCTISGESMRLKRRKCWMASKIFALSGQLLQHQPCLGLCSPCVAMSLGDCSRAGLCFVCTCTSRAVSTWLSP